MNKKKILVIYSNAFYPLKTTLEEFLYCFKKYSGDHVFYFNVDTGGLPEYLKKIDFDLIIFQSLFLSCRWCGLDRFKSDYLKKIEFLKESKGVKIALPQDDYYQSDILCHFINDFKIDLVYSVAPESQWKIIYDKVDFEKVHFFQILTGYMEEHTVKKIARLSETIKEKTIDIGYRAAKSSAWMGKHGHLKTLIGSVFKKSGQEFNLKTDISNEWKDTFFGDDWLKFLIRSKYTIGVEGGASVIDRDGTIRQKGNAYEQLHPEATYEEMEKECFPGMEGSVELVALSPRHLEACATKTCQVLVEGKYNDILYPGVHYIELKKDFSNLNEVLTIIKKDELREAIVSRAYNDIIASGKYTYPSLVDYIFSNSFAYHNKKANEHTGRLKTFFYFWHNRFIDTVHYYKITKRNFVFRFFSSLKSLIKNK